MPPRVLAGLETAPSRPGLESAALRHAALISLAFGGACLTGLLAQVRIPLFFTPIPITGQVLAVLLCGALLGGNYGMLSQAIYVALGILGFKWFNGATSGVVAIAGATGGYLIGFIVAALFLGSCTSHFKAARTFAGQVLLMGAAVAIIYAFGVTHLIITLRLSLAKAIAVGVMPFIAGGVVKVVIAASIATPVMHLRERASQKA